MLKLVINGKIKDIFFFIQLFSNVFNTEITYSENDIDGDLLLENPQSQNLLLFNFKWKYTFLYIEEKDTSANGRFAINVFTEFYSCVLHPRKQIQNYITLNSIEDYTVIDEIGQEIQTLFHFTNKHNIKRS